jgi:hypothetical protein
MPDGWRNITISPIDPDFGEQKAQSCENACFRQQSATVAGTWNV